MSVGYVNPTDGELELLSLLWEHGAMSLSEVHQRIPREVGYTTIQTRLNRLVEKGWVEKAKAGRQPTRYAAVIEPAAVRATRLDHLVETIAPGSVVPLVAHLVQGATLTPDEIAELRKLISEAEQRQQAQTGGSR
jgi:predicted transcriptional regulator